ncbi:hypothetical protein FRC04_008437 [Tulasnella sp. 424]|nr:hypothetical protein FRC04_008437 [Tulasnella sp. 424]KAG8959076.1 hypothetical protein FRC05_008148 [Tulasnella sp. 425]
MPPSAKETLAYLKANHENALHLGNNATPPAVRYWPKPLGGEVLVKQPAKTKASISKKAGKGGKKSAPLKADSSSPDATDATEGGKDEADVSEILITGSDSKGPSNTEESSTEDDELAVPMPVYLSVVGKVVADGSRMSGAGTFFATPEDLEKGDKIWDSLLKARYTLQLGPPTDFESEDANSTFAATIANAKILENMAPAAIGILHKGFVKEDKYIRLGFRLFRDREDDDGESIRKITREWDIGSQCGPGLQYAINKNQVINLPRMFDAKGNRIPHNKLASVVGATACIYFTLEHTHIKKATMSKKSEASYTATLQELHIIIPAHAVPTTLSKRLRDNEQMFGTPSPTKKKGSSAGRK